MIFGKTLREGWLDMWFFTRGTSPREYSSRATPLIDLEGDTVAEVILLFHVSVEDFLGLCAKGGDGPERVHSSARPAIQSNSLETTEEDIER
jgi:hypothetical protein